VWACVTSLLDDTLKALDPVPSSFKSIPSVAVWDQLVCQPKYGHAVPCSEACVPPQGFELEPTFLNRARGILRELAPASFSTNYSQKGSRPQALCYTGRLSSSQMTGTPCNLCLCSTVIFKETVFHTSFSGESSVYSGLVCVC
jgi:hypothetical protein